MKKKISSVFSFFLVLMVLGLFTGCTGNNSSTPSTASNAPTADQSPSGQKPKVTLTVFGTLNSDISNLIGGDPNNIPFYKEMEKQTGVHLNWILSTPEDAQQKLQLLISSQDVPDLFVDGQFKTWYPGGLSKAAADGVIVKLNDYLDKDAPDYKKVIESKPEYLKNVKADNGDIYGFSLVHGSKDATVFFGPMIRKDILDKAGVPVPETIDEWHAALKALKDNGFTTPFSSLAYYISYGGAFTGAYGSLTGFGVGPDGKIHYGAMEDGYRQYLQTFSQWYKEGLIDPDFLTMKDSNVLDTKVYSGKVGASLGWLSSVKKYNVQGKKDNPNFEMVPTKYPVLKKGDKPLYAQADPPVVLEFFVGGTGKHIEDAIKWYNWGYTHEGQLFNNFGIEGVSYTMKDGKPTYTDEVLKNPKGWSLDQAISMYVPVGPDSPTLEDVGYFQQLRLPTPETMDAVKKWGEAQLSSQLPVISFTPDEIELTKKSADIDTYVNEETTKFILGGEPLTNWDSYIKHIKDMGIDDVLKAYNASYDRFNKR
jgi:putative aldouronate transport system substrate-binding protein